MNLDYISTLLSYMITIIISSWTLYTYYNTSATDKDSVSKLYDLMIISYIFLIVSIFIIVLLTTQDDIGNTTMYFVLSILLVLVQTTYTIYQILSIEKKIEKDKLFNFLLTNILFLSLIAIIFMYKCITYFNTTNTTQQSQQYGKQPPPPYYGQQPPYYGQPYYGQPYVQQPPPQVIVVQQPPPPLAAAAASTKSNINKIIKKFY